jgi:uncharacterized membrane protein YeaQ/YmgE (transglycosylase-associated protein family)
VIFFVVLAIGFVAGLVATLVVPGRRRLSLSSTTLVGIVGAGAGLSVAELAGGGSTIARFLLAVVGSIVVLLAAEAAKARVRPPAPVERPSIRELLDDGESAVLEFKGSARRNRQTGERDPRLELTIAKSVAGFANAEGGTLLIGISDDGGVVGLAGDYEITLKGDRDGYELWLRDYLGQRLGTEALHHLHVSFEDLDGADVCRVDVAAAGRPVFLAEPGGRRTADLYVRLGNSTRRLLTDEAIAFTARRFPGHGG